MSRGVREVAVVGGGLAGIAAALRCADAGARVTLLDVRPQLGGAAYSFERDGWHVDNGQHVFLRCCTAYRGLLDRLGVTESAVLQPRLSIPVLSPGRRRARLSRNRLPAPAHLAGALARYRLLSVRERGRVVLAALALAQLDPKEPETDLIAFGDWLRDHGQSERAVEEFWDLIARPTLNLPGREASLALAAFVFQTGLLRSRTGGDLGYASVPLSELHGEPALRALRAAGADVRLHSRAMRVLAPAGERLVVEGTADRVTADAVIVAVPHPRVAGLLPPGALRHPQRLARLGASPIVNIHVVYDRRITDLPLAAGVGSPVQFVFDRTRSSGLSRGQYLAVSLSAAADEMRLSSKQLHDRYLPALADLLPHARRARVLRFLVTREHMATYRAIPGAEALRPRARTGIPGLVLAGAWTATGWPATMEGAVRSGLTAAGEALGMADSQR